MPLVLDKRRHAVAWQRSGALYDASVTELHPECVRSKCSDLRPLIEFLPRAEESGWRADRGAAHRSAMERGSPILCPHSGPAKVRWVKEPPLRLEAYAIHCAGTHHGIAGEPIGDLLEEI